MRGWRAPGSAEKPSPLPLREDPCTLGSENRQSGQPRSQFRPLPWGTGGHGRTRLPTHRGSPPVPSSTGCRQRPAASARRENGGSRQPLRPRSTSRRREGSSAPWRAGRGLRQARSCRRRAPRSGSRREAQDGSVCPLRLLLRLVSASAPIAPRLLLFPHHLERPLDFTSYSPDVFRSMLTAALFLFSPLATTVMACHDSNVFSAGQCNGRTWPCEVSGMLLLAR